MVTIEGATHKFFTQKALSLQSALSGQFHDVVKHFCRSSTGRWADTTAAPVQPGQGINCNQAVRPPIPVATAAYPTQAGNMLLEGQGGRGDTTDGEG